MGEEEAEEEVSFFSDCSLALRRARFSRRRFWRSDWEVEVEVEEDRGWEGLKETAEGFREAAGVTEELKGEELEGILGANGEEEALKGEEVAVVEEVG